MTLTDPSEALAEQSSFVGYLLGLAALARVVRALPEDRRKESETRSSSDDLVFMLLGIASLGDAIERLVEHRSPARPAPASANVRWLR